VSVTVKRTTGPGAKRLQSILEGIGKNCSVKVGWFSSAKYPDGTPVAYVATIQEFGHGKTPPRPFMRPTITGRQNSWRTLLRSQMKKLAEGKTVRDVLTILAGKVEGDIAKGMRNVTAPPLSPVTLQLRKWRRAGIPIGIKQVAWAAALVKQGLNDTVTGTAAKPLMDTRLMFDSITSVVEDKT